MFEYEHLIVNEDILKDPQCYNLIIGGVGDTQLLRMQTKLVFASKDNGKSWELIDLSEYKENRDKYLTPTTNKIVVKDICGKIYFIARDDERYLSSELVPIWSGKHHTEKSREKTRTTMTPKNSKNPRIWISKDGKFKYLRKELLEEYLNNGWVKGRIKS
jgi:hypothetical protein